MGYKQFKNTLDLSNKTKTEIIREVIMEPRSLKVEILKVIAIIMIVTAATWSITKANEILNSPSVEDIIENYSIIGIISEIDDDYVTLTGANVSTGEEGVTKTIYIAKADKIEDPEYRVISLDNLLIGETIILQGRIVNNEDINIERVINFGVLDIVEDDLELASTTDATSTLDVTEASSTNATNTNATSTATTTDDGADSSVEENTDSVIEANATTTEEIIVATTTASTSTDDEIVENSSSTDTSTTTSTTTTDISTSTTTDSTENETDTDETIDEPTTETSTTTEEVSDDTPEEQSTDTTDTEDSEETQTEEDTSDESQFEDTEPEAEQTEEVLPEEDQEAESDEVSDVSA